MKELCYLIIIFFIALTGCDSIPDIIKFNDDYDRSDKVLMGDFDINNEEDLNKIIDYNIVSGNLRISRTLLSDLNGLKNMKYIDGSLSINDNAHLKNLDALMNLTAIGGYLSISRNDSLEDLTGLDNITSIGRFFTISGNESLKNLKNLDRLISVDGYLYIGHNASLSNLDGLKSLTSIGEFFYIEHNDLLNNLTGLKKITTIKGKLNILNNEVLPTCEADILFSKLIEYTSDIIIEGNNDQGICQ